MASQGRDTADPGEFKLMAERAGLGLSAEELGELRPLYEIYLPLIDLLHSVDLKAEEIALAFHPDSPSV